MCIACFMADPAASPDTGHTYATVSEGADAPGSAATGYSMEVGDTFNGSLSTLGDWDWVAINLTAGETYLIELTGGSLFDPYLWLINSAGGLIEADDDDGPGLDSEITFTAGYTGTYYLAADAPFGVPNSWRTGTYTLEVTTTAPPPPPGTVGTYDEMADYLTEGYWGGTESSWDTSSSTQITVDISDLNADGQQLARWAFEAWEMVADLEFVEVTSGAQMVFDDDQSGAFASFATSGSNITSADVNVSASWLTTYGTAIGTYSFSTYIHEIGHALGLGHQGAYNGGASYATDATFTNDSYQLSVMSYFSQTDNTTIAASYADQASAMLVDILAIQNLYGAAGSGSATAGDTTYGQGSNLGNYLQEYFDALVAGDANGDGDLNGDDNGGVYDYDPVAFTIWDQGGYDTVNLGFMTTNDLFDMNAGAFSDIGGLIGNVGIALGTVLERLITGSGNDTVTGNAVGNRISTNDGDDSIDGGAGGDTVKSGIGDDYIFGGTGADSLVGEAGHDTLHGDTSTDILRGDDGNDSITGGTGNDTLFGGDGNDRLFGNTSLDTVYGGGGNDFISSGDGVDYVEGGTGNDTIYGRSGWDTLFGGDGNDSMIGSEGDDELNGGNDNDWLSGGSAWDTLFGNSGEDTLYGNFGSDIMSGGSGNDVLYGGTGDDTARGGDGDDTIQGNQGVDQIEGGAGDDLLRGGTQRDTFVFNTGHGNDEINDFEEGGDTLSLSTDLTGGETNGADILANYASVVGGQVVFDFGGGNTITLSNLSTLSGLEDNILTF